MNIKKDKMIKKTVNKTVSKIIDYKYLFLLILIAGLLLIAPSAIRAINHNVHMVNSDAYYNLRVYNQNNPTYDTLQGRAIPFNILNLLPLTPVLENILFNILPTVLGLLTVILSYVVLKKQNISERTIHAILLLMIVSPIFLYIFTDYKIYSFVIFLTILGIYFALNERIMISGIVFALIPFIDLLSGIITLVLLAVYMFSSQKKHAGYKIVSIILLSTIIFSIVLNLYYGASSLYAFDFWMHNMLIDIGASIGMSFAMIILFVIGLMLLWENGWRAVVTHILLIALMVLSVFNDAMRIYLNFVMIIYAGFAFIYLNKRKWSISIIKKTTILLIVCSVLFSTLVYMTMVLRSEPTPEYIEALSVINKQSFNDEVILSNPDNGYMIEYYTNRSVFIDGKTRSYSPHRYLLLENISTSRNLERTEKLLKENNIRYIVIDSDFNEYLTENEGLLFIMDTSKRFTPIYSNEKVTVWMYTG